MAIFVAIFYVMSLQGLRRLQRIDQSNRPIALFSWARMMVVLGLFVGLMVSVSLIHFILATAVFVTTAWISLWWVTYQSHES
jgi:hypothetical protein